MRKSIKVVVASLVLAIAFMIGFSSTYEAKTVKRSSNIRASYIRYVPNIACTCNVFLIDGIYFGYQPVNGRCRLVQL